MNKHLNKEDMVLAAIQAKKMIDAYADLLERAMKCVVVAVTLNVKLADDDCKEFAESFKRIKDHEKMLEHKFEANDTGAVTYLAYCITIVSSDVKILEDIMKKYSK